MRSVRPTPQHLEGLLAVGGGHDLDALAIEDALERLEVGAIVVDDQQRLREDRHALGLLVRALTS